MTEKRFNGIDVLSSISGVSREELLKVAERAKANIKTLDACNNHDFQPIDATKFGSRHKCTRCGGDVDSLHARWYQRGREHERAKGGTK